MFDHVVLVGAWSASPPESLSLLPYGPRFPVDTGDYFFSQFSCVVGVLIRALYHWMENASWIPYFALPTGSDAVGNANFYGPVVLARQPSAVARRHGSTGRNTRSGENYRTSTTVGDL